MQRSVLVASLLLLGGGSATAEAPHPGHADALPVLAVLSFKAGAGLTAEELSSLEEVMLGALEQTERFQVVGRTDVQTMLDLQAKKQIASCTDDTGCMAAIAGELGADYVAAGNVGRIGTATVITFKVIHVRSGKVLLHAHHTVMADAELINAASKIAEEVVAAVFNSGHRTAEPGAAPSVETAAAGKVDAGAIDGRAVDAGTIDGGTVDGGTPEAAPAPRVDAAAVRLEPPAPVPVIKIVPNAELTAPHPTPSQPVWVSAPPTFLLVRETGSFQASYGHGSSPAPQQWHVQVASDASFHEARIDTTVEAKVTTVDAKDLPPGRWFVRVSAVNEDLVEGPFLGPAVVEIAKAQFAPAAAGVMLVTLFSPDVKVACGIDDGPFLARDVPFEVPVKAERRLRCVPVDAPASPVELTIRPPRIRVSAHLSLSGTNSGTFEVSVHDETGRILTGLQLSAHPIAPLKVGAFHESDGEYKAEASWPPNTPRIVTEFADSQDLVGVKFSVRLDDSK